MSKFFARFAKDESGATAIEYGLIAALIALAVIGGARMVGTEVGNTFENIADELQGATGSGGGGGGGGS